MTSLSLPRPSAASFLPLSLLSHRGQAIHSSSWSPDASVLALAQGALVTIWDPVTSVLRGSLSSPDVPSIHKVAFAGTGGRYVVGAGARKGVAVWDLLGGEVVWSSPSVAADFLEVGGADSATFTTASVSPLADAPSTSFTVHALTSATPVRVRQIPRRIRSTAPYPPTSGPADSTAVLAVADNWDVLLVGDDASSAFDALSFNTPQHVDLAATSSSAGPSLFDEIFGAQAGPSTPSFASSSAPSDPAARPAAAPKKWTSLEEIFDASAQVLPAMSMVFDEVLEHVLSRRDAAEDDADFEERDADANGMDVDEPLAADAFPAAREWQARDVPSDEVASLVDFFKALSTEPSASSAPPAKAATAASRLINKTNGSSVASTPVKPAAATRSAGALRSSATSTPVVNGGGFEADTPQGSGKKRKSKDQ